MLGVLLMQACLAGCLGGGGSPGVAEAIREHWLQAFTIPSGSMIPTLLPGDHFFVYKAAYRTEPPRRGDVVALLVPNLAPGHEQEMMTVIKRVIAEGGDRVRVEAGSVYVNGTAEQTEEVACTEENCAGVTLERVRAEFGSFEVARSTGAEMHSFPEIVVEPDHYYVLGDNRDRSFDSRQWGAVPRRAIIGQVWRIYFSMDPTTSGIRLTRFGRLVR